MSEATPPPPRAPAAPPQPDDDREWHGEYVRYDLIKEFVIALAVITALAVILTILFSSPDDKPTTIQQWARSDPGDFLATAVTELDGTSEVATYGPPYNDTPDVGQKVLGVPTQRWPGVHYRIDTAKDFVLNPLRSIPGNASLRRALAAYEAAPPALQSHWTDAYTAAVEHAGFPGGLPSCPLVTTVQSPR